LASTLTWWIESPARDSPLAARPVFRGIQRLRSSTHANNFKLLKDSLLPAFDQGFSALLEDLD
jgi:hypothetical protein